MLRDHLPSHLNSLMLPAWCATPLMQALIDALPALAGLTNLHLGDVGELDLAPLTQLLQLQRLCLSNHTSMAQRAIIKQLGTLTALDSTFDGWKRDGLLSLLQLPHALQRLQELPLSPDALAHRVHLPTALHVHVSSRRGFRKFRSSMCTCMAPGELEDTSNSAAPRCLPPCACCSTAPRLLRFSSCANLQRAPFSSLLSFSLCANIQSRFSTDRDRLANYWHLHACS